MSLWAIVPVKALDKSKSRLEGVLTPNQRAELSRQMLLHTLQVPAEIQEVERTLVVSADPKVLALAKGNNAAALEERGSPALNKALNGTVRRECLSQHYFLNIEDAKRTLET